MVEESPIKFADSMPDGRALAAEGRQLGAGVASGVTPFCELHDVRSEAEFKASQAETGELSWCMIMGLSSVDEQVAGLRYLHEMGQSSGAVIHRGLVIPNWISGLPPEMREQAPGGTSFVLDGLDDHERIAAAAPIQPCFNDWHIGSPYCLENTQAAIEVGGSYHGVLAQIAWDLPLWKDEVARVAENIRAIGLIGAKRDDWMVVDSYMDDGMGSHFLDNVSLIGYAMLEHYVVDKLCGARYATGFGGLISDIQTKVAVWLALYEVLKAEHPCLSYLYGNTIAPLERDVVQNFGVVATEYAVFAAVERRYRTGISLLPIPITERVEVPTREAIAEARLVAGMAAEQGRDLHRLIRWDGIEDQRDLLVQQGRKFFDNALDLLRAREVDVGDPLQVILGIKAVGATGLEIACHPGERDIDMPDGIIPFVPTELHKMTQQMVSVELSRIRAKGLERAIRGRVFVVASADTHWFGAYAVATVLRELGADVVDLGSERDPEDVVAAVTAAGLDAGPSGVSLAVSTHNGQCLGYADRLLEALASEGLNCDVYLGGKLNAILDGDTEPSDACERLRRMGVRPCTSIARLAEEVSAAAGARRGAVK